MLVLNEIAFYQGRLDEVPNQELAKKLSDLEDLVGIGEIASHLSDVNQVIALKYSMK